MKRVIPVILLVLWLCVLPSAAAILTVTVSGTVSGLSRTNNSLTIANPAQYGCTYPASGTPVCSFTPMESTTLAGTVPDESVFSVFHPGDPVVATSFGGPGGQWIAIAKLYGTAPDKTVIDIVGDPSVIPIPLAGNYSIEHTTKPDCTACTGTICTAQSATIESFDKKVLRDGGELRPNASSTYSGRNDGSSLSVTFVRGQASSASCPGREIMMTGPQPVSVYIIHVVPPLGSVGQAAQTVSATPPETMAEMTMPAEARPMPTKSGMHPFAATGSLALVAVLGAFRQK